MKNVKVHSYTVGIMLALTGVAGASGTDTREENIPEKYKAACPSGEYVEDVMKKRLAAQQNPFDNVEYLGRSFHLSDNGTLGYASADYGASIVQSLSSIISIRGTKQDYLVYGSATNPGTHSLIHTDCRYEMKVMHKKNGVGPAQEKTVEIRGASAVEVENNVLK